MTIATKITNASDCRTDVFSVHPTGRSVLIPVTSADGRPSLIRRQLYVSDNGRLFVMNGGGFDEVRQNALGGYYLVGMHFLEGEWHYDANGALVPGSATPAKTPSRCLPAQPWAVPGASDLRSARQGNDDYGFGF